MGDDKHNQVIFTDTFKTKEIIWEAYYGYISHYKDYKMYGTSTDIIVLLGLNKYAHYLYEEIRDFLPKFKKELGEDEIKKLERIIIKTKFRKEEYEFLRRFYAKFMMESGIKNIIREKEDHDHSVRYSR